MKLTAKQLKKMEKSRPRLKTISVLNGEFEVKLRVDWPEDQIDKIASKAVVLLEDALKNNCEEFEFLIMSKVLFQTMLIEKFTDAEFGKAFANWKDAFKVAMDYYDAGKNLTAPSLLTEIIQGFHAGRLAWAEEEFGNLYGKSNLINSYNLSRVLKYAEGLKNDEA
ncbi:hypothetical protein [Saccharibacillus deserti]|uniref:hypothetical protein n=1 Tax=Saccharibacillus deserti TaxID=1634444 RepID=UPI001555E30F|nr:hypothetical protein [Saccharibacillus deserti]